MRRKRADIYYVTTDEEENVDLAELIAEKSIAFSETLSKLDLNYRGLEVHWKTLFDNQETESLWEADWTLFSDLPHLQEKNVASE